ncbi:MAG: type II and III secretion system protein family protein [Sphingomonas sp.]
MRFSFNAGHRSLALALAAAGTLAATAPTAAQTVAPQPTSTISIDTGRGRLVTLSRPMSDVFVADDKIADVSVRSPTQLYIFGKGSGETTVYATSKSGAVVYSTTVRVGANIASVGEMLKLAMPNSDITATPMNGLILLTGTVANPDDAAEAQRLAQAFVGKGTQVLSHIKTATPLQVLLQVRVSEVSRSFVKNIGVNLQSFDNSGGFQFGIGQGRGANPYTPGGGLFTNTTNSSAGTSSLSAAASGTTIGMAGKLLGLNLLSALDLGETDGQVTDLANTNLAALSGETATFLAGGEIPIPISQGLGAVSVEYKQYGVSLSYTPTVLSDGRISLRVRPEVSQLSAAGAVTLNNVTIPALTTRRAETTIELGSGQSFMIGGLLQNHNDNQITKAPGIADLPIIGTLFRSNAFNRGETELVIVVTPYLVKPVDSQSQIALPTDGYKAPTDLSRVLFGQLSEGDSTPRPVPTMAPPANADPALGAAGTLPAGPAPRQPLPAGPRLPAATPPSTAKGDAAPGFSLN